MITIVGGGIASTALAAALTVSGCCVVAYEERPAQSEGAFLVLDGRGHRALAQLGVDVARLHAVSQPLVGLAGYGTGEPMRRRAADGHRQYYRRDLMTVLESTATEVGVDIRLGRAVTGLDVIDSEVGVRIDGQPPISGGDLVIGADGIDSICRATIEPTRGAVYAGQVILYGVANRQAATAGEPGVLHFHHDVTSTPCGPRPSTFGHMWFPGTEDVLWFTRLTRSALPTDKLGRQSIEVWADAVLAATQSVEHLVTPILEATGSVVVTNARTVPLQNARSAQRPIVLIGDADHAVSPAAGVGARDAVLDAAAVLTAIFNGKCASTAMSVRRRQILDDRTFAEATSVGLSRT